MSNPNSLDRLALAVLSAGVALSFLGGCYHPTTVIGREDGQAANIRTGARKPVRPTANQQRPQVLVKFKERLQATELTSFRAEFGLRNISTIAALGVFVEEITDGRPMGEVLRDLQASPLVEYAEPNQEVRIEP